MPNTLVTKMRNLFALLVCAVAICAIVVANAMETRTQDGSTTNIAAVVAVAVGAGAVADHRHRYGTRSGGGRNQMDDDANGAALDEQQTRFALRLLLLHRVNIATCAIRFGGNRRFNRDESMHSSDSRSPSPAAGIPTKTTENTDMMDTAGHVCVCVCVCVCVVC